MNGYITLKNYTYMKKFFLYFICFFAALPLFIAGCVADDPITMESLEVWPSDRYVAQVQFVSKLTDAAMGTTEADYSAVSNYFTTTLNSINGSWLGIIDRTDVIYSVTGQQNAILKSALDSKHWTYLAFNKITGGDHFEASTLLLNGPVKGATSSYKVANDCYVSGPLLTMEGVRDDGKKISFDIFFRTVRFDAPAHITAFGGEDGVLFKLKKERMNFIMIGTVRKNLTESLRATVASTDNAFKLSIVEGTENADYAIFVLAEEHFWGYAGSSVTSIGNGINAYTLNLNW
jgi:hypothetical protein